jgi:hypothetical protein
MHDPATSGPARTPSFSARDTGSVTRSVTVGGSTTDTVTDTTAKHMTGQEGHTGVASITSPMGSPRSGNAVRDTDIVTLSNGMQTDVRSAVAAGFLTRAHDGSLHDVGAGEPSNAPANAADKPLEAPRQEQQQEQQPAAIEPLPDAEAESLVSQYAAKVTATDAQMAIGSILEGKELNADVVARAATSMGVEPSQVQEHVNQMYRGFEQHARQVATETVLQWARDSKMDDLRAAASDHATTGSVAGYSRLHDAYVKDLPNISPETILQSEDGRRLQARQERNGDITIVTPQTGRIEWRAAIAARIIGPKMVRK